MPSPIAWIIFALGCGFTVMMVLWERYSDEAFLGLALMMLMLEVEARKARDRAR